MESIHSCGPLDPPFDAFPCTVGGGECAPLGPTVSCNPETLLCHECTSAAPDDQSAALQTGHAIVTCAQPPPTCDPGQFDLLFWGAQSVPITGAYLDAGVVVGSSEFVTIRFTLLQDAPVGGVRVTVNPVDFIATDAVAGTPPVSVVPAVEPGGPPLILSSAP